MARVMLNNVVLGFAQDLFKPTSLKGGPEKYRCTPMVDKGSDNDKKIQAAIREVIAAKWGEKKADAILKSITPIPQQFCYRDGDEAEYESSENRMMLKLSNADQPKLLTGKKAPAGKDLIYSGAIVNVSLDIYAYEHDGTKGVAGSVRGVQFVSHGERLQGGGVADEDDFDDIGGADDGDDFE